MTLQFADANGLGRRKATAAAPTLAFLPTDFDRPHPIRRRAILKAHPEVASLIGFDRVTAAITVAVVLGQVVIAAALGHLGMSYWWLSLHVAYGVGAFANHAMFVVIHDAIHNLVLRDRTLNKCVAILADLPNTFPTAMGFRCYHIKHHSHLGDYDFDADLPSRWEGRLVGNRWYGKAIWLFFFAVFQITRLSRLRATVPMWSRWTVFNVLAVVGFDAIILFACGLNGLFYLFASFWFSVGLHPVGARWIQEHFTFDAEQETYDYYGPLNRIALNIGYHNEHHDFPDIPWRRLPELKRLAPEYYLPLKTHRSWSGLLLRFIFDPDYTLFSRVDRSKPAT
jgi:sphingolipid 4-desaturase/C4-monooxygenase